MKRLPLLLSLFLTSNAYSGVIQTSFSAIESTANSTKIRIDAFLPHPGGNNTVFGAIPVDTFTSKGIGFISTGNYADGTSSQTTVDIHTQGAPITWTFVDPVNTNIKATVRQLGFYYGSVQDNVTAKFFDVDNILLDSVLLQQSIPGTSIGFDAGSSSIHKVIFTQSGNDDWFLGSFTQDVSLNDIVFTNDSAEVTSVLEPSTLAVFSLGIVGFYFRRLKFK